MSWPKLFALDHAQGESLVTEWKRRAIRLCARVRRDDSFLYRRALGLQAQPFGTKRSQGMP